MKSTPKLKRIAFWSIFAAFLFVVAAILYPAFPVFRNERADAFRRILNSHFEVASTIGRRPFLYLSWFPTGNSKYAQEYMASYPDGKLTTQRNLYEGVQGTRVTCSLRRCVHCNGYLTCLMVCRRQTACLSISFRLPFIWNGRPGQRSITTLTTFLLKCEPSLR